MPLDPSSLPSYVLSSSNDSSTHRSVHQRIIKHYVIFTIQTILDLSAQARRKRGTVFGLRLNVHVFPRIHIHSPHNADLTEVEPSEHSIFIRITIDGIRRRSSFYSRKLLLLTPVLVPVPRFEMDKETLIYLIALACWTWYFFILLVQAIGSTQL